MKNFMTFTGIGLSVLLTGCVGVGPNTQQGAVTGGALGAIAGAIIGHNSSGSDGLSGAILGATAGAIAGGAMGNAVDHQNGTLYGSGEQAGPPQPPTTSPADTMQAPPDPRAVWVPGYWLYSRDGYAWIGGHWEIPPPRRTVFVAPHWELSGGRYVYYHSYWRP